MPAVMGILNVTDDSFFDGSRVASPHELLRRAKSMLDAGAAILDVGACSTRPGSTPVSQDVELSRLHAALEILDKELPGSVISIDTEAGVVNVKISMLGQEIPAEMELDQVIPAF